VAPSFWRPIFDYIVPVARAIGVRPIMGRQQRHPAQQHANDGIDRLISQGGRRVKPSRYLARALSHYLASDYLAICLGGHKGRPYIGVSGDERWASRHES
jgi:hypothetical protein